MAAEPTFVRPATKSGNQAAGSDESSDDEHPVAAGKGEGKYGRQLARFETMIQQNRKALGGGKKARKVRWQPVRTSACGGEEEIAGAGAGAGLTLLVLVLVSRCCSPLAAVCYSLQRCGRAAVLC